MSEYQAEDTGADDSPEPAGTLEDYQPWLEEEQEDRAERRATIEKHLRVHEDGKAAANAWENSREHRETLKDRYPNVSLKDLFGSYEKLDENMRGNPRVAAEHLARHYLSQPPRFGSDKAAAQKQEGVRGSIEQGFRDAEDKEALAEAIEKHGPRLDFLLQRIVEADTALSDDPLGAAARIAAAYGVPVTPEHHQEIAQDSLREQHIAAISGQIDQLINSGRFPEFDSVADRIADILEDKRHQSTGDHWADLERAYQLAMADKFEEGKKALAEKATKSITGAGRTVPSATSSASTREALSNRFSEMGIR